MDPNRDPDIETKKYIFFLLISILKGYVAIIYLIVRKYMKQWKKLWNISNMYVFLYSRFNGYIYIT